MWRFEIARRLTAMAAASAAAMTVAVACSGRSLETRPSGERPAAEEGAASAGDAPVAPAPERPPPLDEAAARALLAERFRAAGLRIVYDVHVAEPGAFEATLDGFDPERRIGFEYIDRAEVDADLSAAERAALAAAKTLRVLILDASDADALQARADAFLADISE